MSLGFDPDDATSHLSYEEMFKEERLKKDYIRKKDWPAQVDRAALDILYGIAVGKSKDPNDPGGMISKFDFGEATGEFYVNGLEELASNRYHLKRNLEIYASDEIGDLALKLNELRDELDSLEDDLDLSPVLKAVVEKIASEKIDDPPTLELDEPESSTDLILQILSNPGGQEYIDVLINGLKDIPKDERLLSLMDRPQMTTPLWDHQQDALKAWTQEGYRGYVDMATATGKTVLGLAAIALFFGRLHQQDEKEIIGEKDGWGRKSDGRVLVIAGTDLLLEQWREEFDKHLSIPLDRTKRMYSERNISLQWGTIEFRTAQKLTQMSSFKNYDLIILDEAHRYRKGSTKGMAWKTLFKKLASDCEAILAMSGSIDKKWIGDDSAKEALEERLNLLRSFTVKEAREKGIIADFDWNVHYAPADKEDQNALSKSTEPLYEIYDEKEHLFDLKKMNIDVSSDTHPTTFRTVSGLRGFIQSKEGSKIRDSSEEFDMISNSAQTRWADWDNLNPSDEVVLDIVKKHAPEEKCVVLVKSYPQAKTIGEKLKGIFTQEVVQIPKSDPEDQLKKIEKFKDKDDSAKIIIGPGSVLGRGIDMPDAEVAINFAKGGMNVSLIQRIGRVLRNPKGEKEATFYHIVALPDEYNALLIGDDGRRILKQGAEFRALGDRLDESPVFECKDTKKVLVELERAGFESYQNDERSLKEIIKDKKVRNELRQLSEKKIEENVESSKILKYWGPDKTKKKIEKESKVESGERLKERKEKTRDGIKEKSEKGTLSKIKKKLKGIFRRDRE